MLFYLNNQPRNQDAGTMDSLVCNVYVNDSMDECGRHC